jgi:hypothetical protein
MTRRRGFVRLTRETRRNWQGSTASTDNHIESHNASLEVAVFLRRARFGPIPHEAFWVVIRNPSIDFLLYKHFIDAVMCWLCDPLTAR